MGRMLLLKRIFIAIKIEAGDKLLKMISSLKAGLWGDNIKWTNTENIHITLAFIVDTGEEQVSVISKMLKDKCEGFGKFGLIIKGAGVFKSINDPRVIWTGIEPSEKLLYLNELIISGLATAGIRLEARPFRPHLTLGRIKQLKQVNDLKELIERYRDKEIQKAAVNEVILFESLLLQSGPVYKSIAEFMI
jgi:2'-5' RNA ligase